MIQSNMYKYLSILLEGREQFEEEALAEKECASLEDEESGPGITFYFIFPSGTKYTFFSSKSSTVLESYAVE